mmetsp:Transcript_7324/g.6541  ORF Transcript_7324/g.6541 Transcript_7324/m.6541 type:complete len:89 (-) Transcript_7324:1411-1677(-)
MVEHIHILLQRVLPFLLLLQVLRVPAPNILLLKLEVGGGFGALGAAVLVGLYVEFFLLDLLDAFLAFFIFLATILRWDVFVAVVFFGF